MMKRKMTLLTTLLALVAMTPATSSAQGGDTVPPSEAPTSVGRVQWAQEYSSRIGSAKTVGPLSGEIFGESVSLFTGALGFSATDVSLPGNSGLPVAFSRKLDPSEVGPARALGDWDLDLPHLEGVFANDSEQSYWKPAARCSSQAAPPSYGSFNNYEFWSGNKLVLPGGGGGELRVLNGDEELTLPTNGFLNKWVTKDFWFFSCLPTLKSGHAGEGFLAHAPDGTRYYFDRMVVSSYPGITMQGRHETIEPVWMERVKVRLYPSRIEDRFGNFVTYNWSGDRLQSIQADDGRLLTISYGPAGFISSVFDGTRSWQYVVTNGQLTSVLNPDGNSWIYTNGISAAISYQERPANNLPLPMDRRVWCSHQRMIDTRAGYFEQSIRITHPSGAVGEFTVRPTRHGRNNVRYDCVTQKDGHYDEYWNRRPVFQDVRSLVRKRISNPNIGTLEWQYEYKKDDLISDLSGGYAPGPGVIGPTPPPGQSKVVTVTAPDGTKARYFFGLDYALNEGQLRETQVLDASGTILRSTTNAYIAEDQVESQDFPGMVGSVPFGMLVENHSDEFSAAALRPLKQRTITEQGTQFVLRNESYDEFANALTVKRFNSLPGGAIGRSETTEYHHDYTRWVLGQVKNLTVAGALVESTEFTTLSQPQKLSSNGLLVETRAYNGDGTLASVKDGLSKTTTLTNWYRGIPRNIGFADGRSVSATVNALGQITATTDELGYSTGFGYDPMGRVNLVTPPSGDSTAWDSTSITFAKVNADEYGIGVGHWKQSTTTGRYRKEVVFDALWRPVLTHEWDSYLTNSHRYSVRAFDHENRETFAAYPLGSVGTVAAVVGTNKGVKKEYDALGRLEKSIAYSEWELVPLETEVKYLPGNRKQIKNPRGQITEIDYLQYDAPSEDSPTQIQQYPYLYAPSPLATTQIGRDAWGKPTSITRSGTSPVVSAIRSYVYDAHQRLCKTIEPERAAEIFHYDGASRIDWSAKGQALLSTTSCEDTSVAAAARIARGYDLRDRLLTVNYPDTTLDESRTYFADGALQTLTRGTPVTGDIRWSYSYNKRRLMTKELVDIDTAVTGGAASNDWEYDSIGNVRVMKYLNGPVVDYSPNAFGQPMQVKLTVPTLPTATNYVLARTVGYFPNGAMSNFTYGNGVVHTLLRNARDLPWQSRDMNGGATVIDHTYTYDENGNPTVIDDALNIDDKTLVYDPLDRLTSASSSYGEATMTYDALDNITRYSLPGRDWYYDTDAATQRLQRTRTAGYVTEVSLGGYDARGNVWTRTQAGVTQGFTYDLADRVLTTTRNNALQARHRYDGHGRRTKTTKANGDQRFQIYSLGGQFLWEGDFRESEDMETHIDYVSLNGSIIAKLIGSTPFSEARTAGSGSDDERAPIRDPFRNIFADAGATEIVAPADGSTPPLATRPADPGTDARVTTYRLQYVHTDALGSPVAETNTNGTVISGSRTQYEPYGKPRTTPREGAPSYTGHQYDTSTGLIYAQQRYYDPALGRFLSTDPMAVDMGSAGNWNRYAYAANNPYRFTDPDGRAPGAGARYIGEGTSGVQSSGSRIANGDSASNEMRHSREDEPDDYRVFLVAERNNKKAVVGHVFIGFTNNNGEIKAYGFYSRARNIGAFVEGEGANGRVRNDRRSFVRALQGDRNFAYRMHLVGRDQYMGAMQYIKNYASRNDYGVVTNSCVSAAFETMAYIGLGNRIIPQLPAVTPNAIYRLLSNMPDRSERYWPEGGVP